MDKQTGIRTIKLTEISSNADLGISIIQGTKALVEEKHWKDITDHQPLVVQLPMNLEISEVRMRVAKAMFHSPSTRQDIEATHKDTIPNLTEKLRQTTATPKEEDERIKDLYDEIQRAIISPWEKTCRTRPPRKPIWQNATIRAAQRKRGRAANKWHTLALEARRWEDGGVDARGLRAHEDLRSHKKNVLQLERQVRARHEAHVKQRLEEVGLSGQSRSVKNIGGERHRDKPRQQNVESN